MTKAWFYTDSSGKNEVLHQQFLKILKDEINKVAAVPNLSYTGGRMVTYTALGALIIGVGLKVPAISNFRQGMGTYVMGHFVIRAGVQPGRARGLSHGRFFQPGPYSALLFLAAMIPLVRGAGAARVLCPGYQPAGDSIGLALSAGIAAVSVRMKNLTSVQDYLPIAMALVFIVVGVYLILKTTSIV